MRPEKPTCVHVAYDSQHMSVNRWDMHLLKCLESEVSLIEVSAGSKADDGVGGWAESRRADLPVPALVMLCCLSAQLRYHVCPLL